MRSYILTGREREAVNNWLNGESVNELDCGLVRVIRHRAMKTISAMREDLELLEVVIWEGKRNAVD